MEEDEEEWSFLRCSFKTQVKYRCDGKRVLRTPYGIIKSFRRHFKEHCRIPQLTVSVRFSVAHQSFVCYIVKVCKFNKRHRCAYCVNKCRDLLSHRHRWHWALLGSIYAFTSSVLLFHNDNNMHKQNTYFAVSYPLLLYYFCMF